MNILYETTATATSGRDGRARTEDGLLDVRLSPPKELGGAGGATNPEQLFAAGYAACFASAIQRCAREASKKIGTPSVTARIGLGQTGGGRFNITAALEVSIPDLPQAEAEELVRQAHEICPYSNATRGNVDVELRVREAGGTAT